MTRGAGTGPPLRAVLFDLDGTLVRSELDFDRIRREAGIEGVPILEYMAQAPPERRREIAEILERHEAEAAACCAPADGVREVLGWLRTRRIGSAIITRNSRRSAETVMRRLGLPVEAVVAREDAAPKPSPEPVLRACRALGVLPAETLMVGDFIFDIQAGRAAGARTALLRLPGRNYDGVESDFDACVRRLMVALAVGGAGLVVACRAVESAPPTPTASVADTAQAGAPPPVAESPAVSKRDPVKALLDRVEAARKKVRTLTADVTFNRFARVLEINETFEGDLEFRAPRLLRMELAEEDGRKKRLYVIGRKYAWIYYPHKKIAERYLLSRIEKGDRIEMQRAPNPFEYGLVRGLHTLRKAFDMRIAGTEKIDGRPATLIELTAKPRPPKPKKRRAKLMFWIDDESGLPVRIREFKSRGQYVETYTLTDVRVNPTRILPRFSDPFEFDPPRGTHVVPYGKDAPDKGP